MLRFNVAKEFSRQNKLDGNSYPESMTGLNSD